MNEYKKLEKYKWFISAYFNISYRWNELELAINRFFEDEGEDGAEKLLDEIIYIKNLNDWDYIKELNIETAQIYYEEDRNKEMMKIIIEMLTKKMKN